MTILIYILFLVYSSFEGIKEAIMFHYKVLANNKDDNNEHMVFSIQRGSMIIALSLFSYLYYNSIVLSSCFGLSLMLGFSFLHNGLYYTVRDMLTKGVYPKHFFDNTHTSNAKMNFGFIQRTFLFLMSIVLLILINKLK